MILSMTSADKKESGAPPGATMNQTAVSVFSAVGVVLTLGGLMVTEHNSLRGEINGLRTEMIEGQSSLRTEMIEGQSSLRTEMTEGQSALRREMTEGQSALRAAMIEGQNAFRAAMIEGQSALRTEISGLRDDMREDQAALRAEMIESRGDVNEIRVILSDMGERVARIETRLDLPGPD